MEDFGIDGSASTDIVEAAIESASQGVATFPTGLDNNSTSTPPIGADPTTPTSPETISTGVNGQVDVPTFGTQSADDLILPPAAGGNYGNLVATGAGDDKVTGSTSTDILAGGSGNDQLSGGFGDDQIAGGPGNDVIDGGEGSDILLFGEGQDLAVGGSGGDEFVLPSQGVSDPALASRILDFDPTEGDMLLLPAGIKPEDLTYELDDQGNTLVRLADGSILMVLEGVDLSELFDLEGDGGPVRPADEQLDDRPSGAKDLGILSGERLAEGQLTSRDTYDLFKFRVETSTLLDSILTPANGADVQLTLYQDKNRDGVLTADEELASTADDKGSTAQSIENYLLKPGEYYLSADLTDDRAKNTETPFSSSYKLNLLGTAAATARDTAGNSLADAVVLGYFSNLQVNESLNPADLADIYRIEFSEGDYLKVYMTGELTGKVTLALVQDLDGTGLIDASEIVEFGTDGLIASGLAAGSYYLVAIANDGVSGSYQLNLEMGGGSPSNNETRNGLISNQTQTGEVSRQSRVDRVNPSRRFEEYQFDDVNQGDKVSLLISSADGTPTVELWDLSGSQVQAVGSAVPGTSSVRLDFTIPDQRDYGIRIYSPVDKDFSYRVDMTNVTSPGVAPGLPVARSSEFLGNPMPTERYSRVSNKVQGVFLSPQVISEEQAKAKKPDPIFTDSEDLTIAYLDYRLPGSKVFLTGSTNAGREALKQARIIDINQGSLGDCAFLGAVAALFGRVNPHSDRNTLNLPKGNDGEQLTNSPAKKPNEASSPAIESLLQKVDGSNYTFQFYSIEGNEGEKSQSLKSVTIDNTVLTAQKEFDLTKFKTARGKAGNIRSITKQQVQDSDGDTVDGYIVTLNNNDELTFYNTPLPDVLKQFEKIKLGSIKAGDQQTQGAADLQAKKTPYAAAFSKDPNDKTVARGWVNSLERAYAAFRQDEVKIPGYSAIGNGDNAYRTLGRLTGRAMERYNIDQKDPKDPNETLTSIDIFDAINAALDRGDFVGAGAVSTYSSEGAYGEDGELRPDSDEGDRISVVGSHVYAVTDAYFNEEGERRVVVYNPHGKDTTKIVSSQDENKKEGQEVPLNDQSAPVDDGFIDLPLGQFIRYFYQNISISFKDDANGANPTPITPTTPAITPTLPTNPTLVNPAPIVPPPSTLQPQPNGGIAPATPAEFLTLTPQVDRFSIPAIGTASLGKVRALAGNDTIEGSAGNDEVFGNQGADVVNGRAGDDRLWGGQGKDRLYGNDGNDFLKGEQGNDLLVGGKGNDTLGGSFGNDVLVGSEGTDSLTGGRGADVFALLSPFAVQDVNVADRISDFVAGEGDRIALTDGLTGDRLVLESAGQATVIRLKSNNAILGVVENAAPANLRDRFTTYGAALKAL